MNQNTTDEMNPEKSRTRIKREMTALQDLGGRLLKLSDAQLQRLNLPAELREAVHFARSIKSRGALRRQIQYIGVLMRDIDSAPIEKALDQIHQASGQEAASFKQIELWRDALIAGDAKVLENILQEFPEADRAHINQLARNAGKERTEGKPPKAFRALFRYLKALCQSDAARNSEDDAFEQDDQEP